ncbi:hypothetical protein ACHAWF_012276 [Thalassiosira exigua]
MHAHQDDHNEQQGQSKTLFPSLFRSRPRPQSPKKRSVVRPSGALLYNCSTHDEHEAMIATALHVCRLYQSGDDVIQFKYGQKENNADDDVVGRGSNHSSPVGANLADEAPASIEADDRFDNRARHALSSLGFEFRLDTCQKCHEESSSMDAKNGRDGAMERCIDCVTRLYHIPSNKAVTKDNRKKYIADGQMYDAVANLCQSAAQEIMAESCELVWVTVCDGRGGGLLGQCQGQHQLPKPRSNSVEEWPRDEDGKIIIQEPIRALVSGSYKVDYDKPRDTFLVATGKGKVRAGVFSRHHLLTTGLEPSTALSLLREARDRGMNCVVIDPNARGDRKGMDTFETSIRCLFEQESSLTDEGDEQDGEATTKQSPLRAIIPANVEGSIYVLAHSAAGGQLVRYLLDQQQGASLLTRIRCITFTDSTHSVQWLKRYPHISSLIQSSSALYVRSANPMRDDDWEQASPGDECPRDHFWSHRFGDIKTVWAGTTEHSLSNWTAIKPIWDHFDRHLSSGHGPDNCASDIQSNDDDKASTGEKHTPLGTSASGNRSNDGGKASTGKKQTPGTLGTKPTII